MPTYRYQAISGSGQSVAGVITAENQATALRMLDDQSLFPTHVEEGAQAGKSVLTGGGGRVRLRHLTTFYTQLADLLKAGVPLLRSLDVIAKQRFSPALSGVVREVRETVAGGAMLADAMEMHPTVFSHLHSSMVRAGESGGFLEEVLWRLASFADRQNQLRNKMIGSMIYPCILVLVGMTVVIGLMVYVVPQLRGHMKVETFNLMTHVVFGISDFLTGHWKGLLLGTGALVFALVTYFRSASGRVQWAKLQLRAPALGPIYTMVAVCRFARILGTMLRNGVPILNALLISKDSAGNMILAGQIEKAHESVKRGETLSKPLGESGLFPPDVIDMIAVAEESNTLDAVLVQIADTNEQRTGRMIDTAVKLIEPLMLVAMAGMVLMIAVALLLPILSMSTAGV